MRSVGELVKLRLESMRHTEAWLERRLGLKHRGEVNKVISGKRGLPLKSLEAWVAALGLHGPAADEFRLAAHLQRTDPIVCEEMDRLISEAAKARSMVSDYATRVQIIRRLVEDLSALHGTEPPAGDDRDRRPR